MDTLILQIGDLRTSVTEVRQDTGVRFSQGPDFVTLTWDEAIRVRDWLQLAIAERTERLAVNGADSVGASTDA